MIKCPQNGGQIKIKKRASYLRERGEGMSITEAPDVTVTSSSPWRCCGRQQKTSLEETGGTKAEYYMRKTKKEGRGGWKKPVFSDTGQVCVRDGVTIYSGNGCQGLQVDGPPNH